MVDCPTAAPVGSRSRGCHKVATQAAGGGNNWTADRRDLAHVSMARAVKARRLDLSPHDLARASPPFYNGLQYGAEARVGYNGAVHFPRSDAFGVRGNLVTPLVQGVNC
jgi:hypothetical protein